MSAFMDTVDDEVVERTRMSGFFGKGSLQIAGLPKIPASFAFLRGRRSDAEEYKHMFFVFVQAERISYKIP